jgi:hypothetical protein
MSDLGFVHAGLLAGLVGIYAGFKLIDMLETMVEQSVHLPTISRRLKRIEDDIWEIKSNLKLNS